MSVATAPYRSQAPAGRPGFLPLIRAEWTKLRTVRSWVIALMAAAALPPLLGLLSAGGSNSPCQGDSPACTRPTGPGGEAVSDHFYFVHQPLSGDGSITVRVTSLTGELPANGDPGSMRSGVHEWAKAGVILKESTTQGSRYAAIMLTGDHGVRMQYDYVHDTAGSTHEVSASPRWLRLVRSGDTLTGYESADGTEWAKVGEAQLSGLDSTVEAGLFVASPEYDVTDHNIGFTVSQGGPSQATAGFDNVTLSGGASSAGWSGDEVGGSGGGAPGPATGFEQSGDTFSLTGTGDIAPVVGRSSGDTVGDSVATAFAGLLVVVVLAAMFITSEHRQGLIRTTLAASPRRGRVLAAKAVVLAAVTFVAGLLGTAVQYWVVARSMHSARLLPASSLTEWRVVAGTALLFPVAAVFALAVGTVVRRSAAAITAVVVLIVLPYILAVSLVVPAEPGRWLLRLTPAAAFAIQQNAAHYAQVGADYTPAGGYYPLAPWAGFAVLCGWTAVALGLAGLALRRRDP